MVNKNIPFYSNTSDDTHCLQACLKMLLKYFYPNEEYSWEELDKLTGKKEGMWTWTMDGFFVSYTGPQGMCSPDKEVIDYQSKQQRELSEILNPTGEKMEVESL